MYLYLLQPILFKFYPEGKFKDYILLKYQIFHKIKLLFSGKVTNFFVDFNLKENITLFFYFVFNTSVQAFHHSSQGTNPGATGPKQRARVLLLQYLSQIFCLYLNAPCKVFLWGKFSAVIFQLRLLGIFRFAFPALLSGRGLETEKKNKKPSVGEEKGG